LADGERELSGKRHTVVLRSCFGKWHSAFHVIAQKRLKTDACEEELAQWQLARWFLHWKSRDTMLLYDTTMLKKARRRLSRRILGRMLSLWGSHLQVRLAEKQSVLIATRFRVLSLASKAFNQLRIYTDEQRRCRHRDRIARRHYVVRLAKSVMFAWRLIRLTTRRRYLMVISVLKLWAHNLQLREFQQWQKYKNAKRERRRARHNALEVYRQRSVRLSLTGFILSAQHAPPVHDSGSDEELQSSSMIVEEQMPRRPPAVESGLTAPKRPGFLVPGKARIAIPEQVEAVIPKSIEVEENGQKQRTLVELNELMEEIGHLASEF
jgi:hypothetical protein